MAAQTHKSFRLTPPAYMKGRRVNRRLWWIRTIGTVFSLAASLAGFLVAICGITAFKLISSNHYWADVIVGLFTITSYYAGAVAFATTCVVLRLLSRSEAQAFLVCGKRWPESWLEPIKEE